MFCFHLSLKLGWVKLHCKVNCLIVTVFEEWRNKFEQGVLKHLSLCTRASFQPGAGASRNSSGKEPEKMSLLSAPGGDFQDTWHVGLISFSAFRAYKEKWHGSALQLSSAPAHSLRAWVLCLGAVVLLFWSQDTWVVSASSRGEGTRKHLSYRQD